MSEKEEGKIIDKFLERFNSEKTILLMYLGDFNEPEILEIRDILVELNIIKNQENKYYLCISVFHHTPVMLAITSLSNSFSPKYLRFNL
jgi:hypothetical protein